MKLFLLGVSLIFSVVVKAKAPYKLPPKISMARNENIELVKRISSGLEIVAAESKKALVAISTMKNIPNQPVFLDMFDIIDPSYRDSYSKKQQGLGSGFILDLDKKYVVTNAHVVDERDDIVIKTTTGLYSKAKVLGKDNLVDLAVLEILDPISVKGLKYLSISEEPIQEGTIVFALGNPFGLQESISFGIVSGKERGNLKISAYGSYFQTDASVNPGNSGGPLVNMEGEVVGVNTAIFSTTGASIGVHFAIPGSLLKKVVLELINEGEVKRGFLGIYLQDIPEKTRKSLGLAHDQQGVVVYKVTPKSPAEKAGLQEGDVIVGVNDKPLQEGNDFSNIIGMSPGSSITLSLWRHKKNLKIPVVIGELSEKAEKSGLIPHLGLILKPVNSGLKIVKVLSDSPAHWGGLQPDDIISHVDGTKVSAISSFEKATLGGVHELTIVRNGKTYRTAIVG